MKIARIGERGRERPAAIDAASRPRALTSYLRDLTPEMLSPDQLAWLREVDVEKLPIIEGKVRYGVPIAGTRKFIAIGLNYSDHAEEAGMPIPSEPVVFMKAVTSIAGPDDDVPMPRDATKIDWEVELGIVIGSPARYVEHEQAMNHVAPMSWSMTSPIVLRSSSGAVAGTKAKAMTASVLWAPGL